MYGLHLRSAVSELFKCNPQYASFNVLRIAESGKVPKCLSVNSMNSILHLNLVLDFTALAIPVILLWKVYLSWKKKACIFGLSAVELHDSTGMDHG
jgi:hypothetical protein